MKEFTKEGVMEHLDEMFSALEKLNQGLDVVSQAVINKDDKKWDQGMKQIDKTTMKIDKKARKS
jgi:hypothetical protein